MRIAITPFALLAIMASMLYSFTPQSSGYGAAPYGDDMLVQTFNTKNEFDDVEDEAWHLAEEAHLGSKLQCWASCVWKKFKNLFGGNDVVPEECSWGTCPGPGTAPTE